MSSIKFSSFGAATMPLSKVVVDKDLDMDGYDISGVDTLRADTLRAGRVYSPIDTDDWPTETLDWGDGEPEQLCHVEHVWELGSSSDQSIMTVASDSCITVTLTPIPGKNRIRNITLKVNGVAVATYSTVLNAAKTFPSFVVMADDVIVISAGSCETTSASALVTIESDGKVRGEKTFDLAGKWLALGIDMKGLAATVKIQGVEMPYSDYLIYFPIAPSELKIPGEWTRDQIRPVIEVYV